MLERVKELRNLGILDTGTEELFDEIVRTATEMCEAPISLISLLDEDRQWFKAKIGTDVQETPIGISVCRHTIDEDDGMMLVKDLSSDQRFCDNPFVVNDPNLRAYCGVSLLTDSGERIGTVCVFDDKVREFTPKQIQFMQMLSKFTMRLVNDKVAVRKLQKQNTLLNTLNSKLDSFTYMVAHDVKAPLKLIDGFTNQILEDANTSLSTDSQKYLQFVQKSSAELGKMISILLNYSKQVQLTDSEFQLIDLEEMLQEEIAHLDFKKELLSYEVDKEMPSIFTSRLVLQHVVRNIISNAISYRDKSKSSSVLKIQQKDRDNFWSIIFEDNGIGMSEEREAQVFDLFSKDRRNLDSTGVGLCVAKDLLEKIGGKIEIRSELNVGTTITVILSKVKM